MADDVTLPGTGEIVATDDVGGKHYQYTKQVFGTDGTATLVSTSNPLPVNQTAALPAGDNNIGNVDVVTLPALAAGTNNIGDVDVLSVVPGIGATALGKAIGTAVGATDTGVAALVMRDDALSTLSDAEGDFVPQRVDEFGALWTHLVDDSGAAVNGVEQIVDDAAFTPATSAVMMAGFFADEASTDSVTEGDGGAARMTLDRKVITTPQPHTTGGLSIHRSIDLDEGTLEVVKNAPGQLYGWYIANLAATTVFVKFYNATSGTAGTGTPVLTLPIPANSTDECAAANALGAMGITFDTGICVGATGALADADTSSPGTSVVIANLFYK